MANDLISRADAIDVLETGAEFLRLALGDMDVVRSDREKFAWGLGLIETFMADIKELPSADVVEVVRCKDCKYYDPKECCIAFGHWFGEVNMIPMGFCSLAERREDE